LTKSDIAIKLLMLFLPWYVSMNLPKGTLRLIYGETMMPTDGWPTASLFPPGWQPGDPLPPGVTLDPSAFFPPGWQPGDPLPPGVTLDPSSLFPPGWKPGTPLPPGYPAGLPLPIDPFGIPDYLKPGAYPPTPFRSAQGELPAWYAYMGPDYWTDYLNIMYIPPLEWYDATGGPPAELRIASSWTGGWKPTLVRFQHDQPYIHIAVLTETAQVVAEADAEPGQEFTCTVPSGHYIHRIVFSDYSSFTIDAIEFYGLQP